MARLKIKLAENPLSPSAVCVCVHALLSIIAMLLNALTALGLNRPEKARSITMLAR